MQLPSFIFIIIILLFFIINTVKDTNRTNKANINSADFKCINVKCITSLHSFFKE